jgi:hypothetical protein
MNCRISGSVHRLCANGFRASCECRPLNSTYRTRMTKLELVINLPTAKALGLANEVIE